jgi:glycosyltransferase involved in cell wall biosynthesis
MTAFTATSDAKPVRTPQGQSPRSKILFASAHSVLDFSNGASVASLDVLQGLTTCRFECQAFCTAKLDLTTEVGFEKMIDGLNEPFQLRPSVCGDGRAPVLYTRRNQVPITFIRQESTRHVPQSHDEIQTVLRFFARFLGVYRPDVLLTYGGDPITQGMISVARLRGIPVVFAIHNFAYEDARHFSQVDHCLVPSEFARRHYRDTLGLDCRALNYPVDWKRVRVDHHEPRYLTFVNPALYKGAYPFVRIAQELGRRRPDIPLLVVESRGTRATLGACGLRPADHPDIQIMPVTTDPRRFWRLTRVLLMPSLWWETQGLVAVEAMINGIPVIGSDRGALPETLGDAGVVLPLPDRLTPTSPILPTAEEVEPWVDAIIRLWDDQAWYQEQSARARTQAQLWHPDRLRPLYAEFFGGVSVQGRPPLVVDPAAVRSEPLALSFVACVSDEAILKANVLSSPCLHLGCPHEFTVIKNCPSAAGGLNRGLKRARHDWVVCVHQDVVLSDGWDQCLARQLREAERRFGPIGVAGVYGVGEVILPREPGGPFAAARTGWVVDRGRTLRGCEFLENLLALN